MDEAVERIETLMRRRAPAYVVTPNVDHIVKVEHNAAFKAAYDNASMVLADGMPLLWAGRFLKTPIRQKVSGSDLFPRFCEVAAARGHKLFFLGGLPGAVERSAELLSQRHPGLNVVGMHCPPMGFENDPVENRRTIDMIKASGADLLFVGLGTPKQELWIWRHHVETGVPVSIGIGASFDFIAGMQKRAPLFMQKLGFEWFWRLALDPKRMYRRYLIDDPEFFLLIWRQRQARKRAVRARASMHDESELESHEDSEGTFQGSA
jgi:N-acetylglucosaminyldiphosphoundecaprenol N-acetyl-beta-D-mannosaminyltransferase